MTRQGAAFSMAEPMTVMMRQGEEEDEEGAEQRHRRFRNVGDIEF